ncbi:ubiquitin-60S ribosomal protein L40 [Pyrus ussuriensis x Pyrus communis]|uniref:Ubiquitin-60S ribosomal protein L40 n=1 Tax=Pyrus ussuriensis x Pyrus communis TaxID=2448454 RepID=A0A5N5G196_9ROSA|nr:ubiquitin-60S ribosomal protein L40 [Pyrus ussuriensis x Pyrus communis]
MEQLQIFPLFCFDFAGSRLENGCGCKGSTKGLSSFLSWLHKYNKKKMICKKCYTVDGKHVSCSIFVDLEPIVIDEVRYLCSTIIVHLRSLLSLRSLRASPIWSLMSSSTPSSTAGVGR